MLAVLARESCSVAACARMGASWLSRSLATGSGRVVELESHDEWVQAINTAAETNTLAVIKFTARWCGPCKMIAPLYEKLSNELPHVRFYTVDIDREELREAVLENNVVGVPNFAFYRRGERVASFRGAKKDLLLGSLQELEGEEQQQQEQQLAF